MSLNLTHTLIVTLRHPTTIAALSSVSLHAMVGVALPNLPMFAPPPEDAPYHRNVQVIELTPDEIGRLPDLSPPPLELPEIPTALVPGRANIPTLENLPLPEVTSPVLPPPPGGTVRQPSNQSTPSGQRAYSFPINPPSTTVQRKLPATPPAVVGRPNTPPPPPQTTAKAPTPRDRENYLFQIDESAQAFRIRPLEEVGNPARLLPGASRSEEGEEETPTASRRQPESSSVAAQPGNIRATSQNEGAPPLTPEQVATLQRQQAFNQRLSEQRNLQRRTDQNTTNQEAERNYTAWRNNVTQNVSQGQGTPQARTIRGNYPADACLRRMEGTAVYGLVIQPDGSVSNVQQIRSAGYALLDQQARSQVTSLGLPRGEQPIPYRVSIQFTYDPQRCPTLSVPDPETVRNQPRIPQGTPAPSPQPKPENPTPARPEPSPSPRPTASPSPSPEPAPSPPESQGETSEEELATPED
ncbi:TonB family protein [Spirulina subsalsa FACHB-351]|uniref:TonB family protein n=1 Tax=Spirulina subsalsa FACHB-351 TaxID=234711 RepID=A0ABT3LBJ0_9CYAN|nr:TonB family protein [Spirulina subsalsa]MCW6038878.1 TonB family protein [Spirulina subsalsa FACHB-351]